jgi:hypothetical protein
MLSHTSWRFFRPRVPTRRWPLLYTPWFFVDEEALIDDV